MIILGNMDGMKYYTVCWWFQGWLLFEILALSSLHPPSLDKDQRAGPEQNWALNNPSFHPVSSEPPTPYVEICITEWLKLKVFFSTFTLLSQHLTGLLGTPLNLFPCDFIEIFIKQACTDFMLFSSP